MLTCPQHSVRNPVVQVQAHMKIQQAYLMRANVNTHKVEALTVNNENDELRPVPVQDQQDYQIGLVSTSRSACGT